MIAQLLKKIFEHNTWANLEIIQACSDLSDDKLDAEPKSATKGSIRITLMHLLRAEKNYIIDLIGNEPNYDWQTPPTFEELKQLATANGDELIALISDANSQSLQTQIHTSDGYTIEPWVIIVQAINHATEHREQIKSMLTSMGITPPRVDGWVYGRFTHAMIPPTK